MPKSPNASTRDNSWPIRSTSSRISSVNSRSWSPALISSKLRRAHDTGQRVLDLVRQHRRHADHRPRRISAGQLAPHPFGVGARMDGQDDVVGPARRGKEVDHPHRRVGPVRTRHCIRPAPPAGRRPGASDRSAGCPHPRPRSASVRQISRRARQKVLGGAVDRSTTPVTRDQQGRVRQSVPEILVIRSSRRHPQVADRARPVR